MSGTIEQKMLQAIMFVFETSVTAISGLFDYCVFKKCKVDDLEGFLNKFEFKHTLFHLYNNDVTCCECETRFQGRNQVLKKVDFETLYKYVGRSHPHIKRNEKGTITQVCICDFEAKPGITLNDLDITLMAKILRNSCIKLVHPAALTGVDEIKERRNRICHAGRLDSLKDGDVDKMLQELETYVLQVIQQIQHKSFQTSIKTQIRLLKSSTIQHEEALIIIKQTECIVAAEKLILIGIIEGNTKQLGNKMESLHEQSLQCYQKGTEDLKKKSGDIKKELKDNQEVVTSTQKEHTVKLDKIEHMSEDVLQTTTETKHEQLKQTSIIATIQKSVDQLKANDLNEEDKEGLKKLKDSFAKIKNLTGILDGCDVECQTDTECMQFELGENSKAVLRVQNDHMEEKLEKIMNSLDRIHGQYETIASSKATTVLSGNDVLRGIDVGCQTDIESMQFELGEN